MESDKKSFIEELRSLDEPTKHKIMIGTVIVSMFLVVYLWFAYFNTIVQNTSPVAAQASTTSAAEDSGGLGIGNLFADAASSLWQSIAGGAKGMVNAVRSSKKYNINPR